MVELYAKWLNYHSALSPLLGLSEEKEEEEEKKATSFPFPQVFLWLSLSFLTSKRCGYLSNLYCTEKCYHTHLKGWRIFQLLDCRRRCLWRIADLEKIFRRFLCSKTMCTGPKWRCRQSLCWFFFNLVCRAVGTMQVRAIHPHRPTILSCTMIVATVWTVYPGLCIVDLPKHPLLYVCDALFFFFCSGTEEQRAVLLLHAPEGSRLQISVFVLFVEFRVVPPELCSVWPSLGVDEAYRRAVNNPGDLNDPTALWTPPSPPHYFSVLFFFTFYVLFSL